MLSSHPPSASQRQRPTRISVQRLVPSFVGIAVALAVTPQLSVAVTPCDSLAALPSNEFDLPPIHDGTIDGPKVVEACDSALESDPKNPALKAQKGRGLIANGQVRDGFKLIRSAARRNYPPALVLVGSLYEAGTGTDKSVKKAIRSFEKANKLGSLEARWHLARLSFMAEGSDEDIKASIETMEEVAEQGVGAAAAFLADIHMSANKVDYNWRRAVYWANKAELVNDPDGMYLLGHWHSLGKGVQFDRFLAEDYFIKAAALGSQRAKMEMAIQKASSQPKTSAKQVIKAVRFFSTKEEIETLVARYRKQSRNARKALQAELVAQGYDTGGIDGALGNKTRAALTALWEQ